MFQAVFGRDGQNLEKMMEEMMKGMNGAPRTLARCLRAARSSRPRRGPARNPALRVAPPRSPRVG